MTSSMSQLRRLGERFTIGYFGMYLIHVTASGLPWLGEVEATIDLAAARLLFGAGLSAAPQTGSGDRAVDWAAAVVLLLAAAFFSAMWSLARPRRTPTDERLGATVHLLVRLFLALVMIAYGGFKVLKSQFPTPGPAVLDQAFGDASPMRLLWTFMGASTGYTMFTGAIEIGGGALLLFRKSRLFGALVTAGAMANVLALNLSYDVPVKLGSLHYLLMAVFVAWPDRDRLGALVVPPSSQPWPTGRARWAVSLPLGALVLFALFSSAMSARENYAAWGDGRVHHALYGRYDVVEPERGETTEPTGGAPDRWQRLLFEDEALLVKTADGEVLVLSMRVSDDTVELRPIPERPGDDGHFTVERHSEGVVELRGSYAGKPLSLSLRAKRSRLIDRGFHWVSEAPYNR